MEITDEQRYKLALSFMESHLKDITDPCVGIFWYEKGEGLFGVIRKAFDDPDNYMADRVGIGYVSCSELHKDVWKKEYRHQKYHRGGVGPFVGDYKDTPRGRIFYDSELDEFYIYTGKWIYSCPEVKEMILETFNLKGEYYHFKIGEHWEIGMGYPD